MLGLSVSGAFLYFTLRDVEFALVWRQIRSAELLFLMLAFIVMLSSNLIRAVRWGALMGDAEIKLRFLFSSMMIGYLANNVLPARLGEIVRVYILEHNSGANKSTALATVFIERLTDVMILLMLILFVSFFQPLPSWLHNGVQLGTAGAMAIAIATILFVMKGEQAFLFLKKRFGFDSSRFSGKIEAILKKFLEGLSVLRSRRQLALLFLLTLVIWGCEALIAGLVMKSLDMNLPWIAALFVLVVLSLSFIIPAAPGAIGTYEFFTVAALVPFAVENDKAVGLALVLHALTYVTSSLLGLICLGGESLSWREVITNARNR